MPGHALILFGPPGSGKGTQSALLSERLGIPHISTGDMLRRRANGEDEVGLAIRRTLGSGALVSDELVNRMIEERIQAADCAAGFILDGYPRTLGQAESLTARLVERRVGWIVVHLKVDYNVVIGRLAGRRHCSGCAAVYNATSNPPKVLGLCDLCGSGLTVREDDSERVVRRRLEAYEARTRPLLEFFAGYGSLFEIPGCGAAPSAIACHIDDLWNARTRC